MYVSLLATKYTFSRPELYKKLKFMAKPIISDPFASAEKQPVRLWGRGFQCI